MGGIVAHLEKRFALVKGDATLVFVVAERQGCAQVKFHLRAIGQRHTLRMGAGLKAFIGTWHPAQLPAAISRCRNRQKCDRSRHAKTLPAAVARYVGQLNNLCVLGRGRWQVFGNLPDLLHGFKFECVQWIGVQPHSEGFTLPISAVGFVQTHAPLSRRFSNGIVLGFCEACFAHLLSLVLGILTPCWRSREHEPCQKHVICASWLIFYLLRLLRQASTRRNIN